MFVYRLEPTLYVYYNSNTVQMASRNGLHTLVADGVHSFQPRQLKRKDQLYIVHGVCRNGVEVPLPHAFSSKKTEQVYTTIFRHLRDEFNASVYPANLSVVLDFEKASIKAAKRVFLGATVQSCAFHSARATGCTYQHSSTEPVKPSRLRLGGRPSRSCLLPSSAPPRGQSVDNSPHPEGAPGLRTMQRVPQVLGGDMVHGHVR
ncbi:hypothetical protein Aduo_012963 [Ancylostoma duodenale]